MPRTKIKVKTKVSKDSLKEVQNISFTEIFGKRDVETIRMKMFSLYKNGMGLNRALNGIITFLDHATGKEMKEMPEKWSDAIQALGGSAPDQLATISKHYKQFISAVDKHFMFRSQTALMQHSGEKIMNLYDNYNDAYWKAIISFSGDLSLHKARYGDGNWDWLYSEEFSDVSVKVGFDINLVKVFQEKHQVGDEKSEKFIAHLSKLLNDFVRHNREIYEIIVKTPNYDSSEISTLIMDAITQFRHTPGFEGCEEAFKIMESRIDILKENLPIYHEKAVNSSGDQSVPMLAFIEDASKGEMKSSVKRQFLKISNTMRKKMTEQANRMGRRNRSKTKNAGDFFNSVVEEMVGDVEDEDDVDL